MFTCSVFSLCAREESRSLQDQYRLSIFSAKISGNLLEASSFQPPHLAIPLFSTSLSFGNENFCFAKSDKKQRRLLFIHSTGVTFKVPGRGLEPPCLAAPAPKAGVSTNFTIPACSLGLGHELLSASR